MDTDDGFRSGAAAPGGRQAGAPNRSRRGSEPNSTTASGGAAERLRAGTDRRGQAQRPSARPERTGT